MSSNNTLEHNTIKSESSSLGQPPVLINVKYKYSDLSELSEIGDYNFYGIIIDASFPIKIASQDQESQYECVIRVIDSTISDKKEDAITLIIKSTNRESVPFIHNLGDIIRVHRAVYNPKKMRNAYLQILKGNQFKSSWTLFSGISNIFTTEILPYASSHDNYTFESQDRNIIERLRTYLKGYLERTLNLNYTKQIKLNQRLTEGSDNDLLVFVVKKVEMQDQITFFILDDTDGCELHTYKYFNFIKEGDVIRIRAYKLIYTNILVLNEFSNIIKIPPISAYYKQFMNSLVSQLKNFNLGYNFPYFEIEEANKTEKKGKVNNDKKKFICKIKPKIANNFKVKTVAEINKDDQKFILNLSVMEIYPKPIYNFINVICEKCQNCYFMSEVELNDNNIFHCPKCQTMTEGKMHYNCTLQCRENFNSDQLITLYLNTYDFQGNNFFGMKPCDCYRNNDMFAKLKNLFGKICDKDNYISVLVERYDQGILRIVGDYDFYDK